MHLAVTSVVFIVVVVFVVFTVVIVFILVLIVAVDVITVATHAWTRMWLCKRLCIPLSQVCVVVFLAVAVIGVVFGVVVVVVVVNGCSCCCCRVADMRLGLPRPQS
jgi:hypothetical protein